MAVGGRIDWHEAALAELLTSLDGPTARDLQRKGERVAQEAKRLAPTSPHGSGGRPSGFLRSAIGYKLGHDEEGLFVDVASPATTASGSPYGLFQEVGTSKMAAQPHLRPALDILRGGTGGGGGISSGNRVAYTSRAGRTSMVTQKQAANYSRSKG